MEAHYQIMKSWLWADKHPVILELGANDGYHTKMLMSFCSVPPVYHAFEPDPRNVSIFRANTMSLPVVFNETAVCDRDGTTTFYMSTPEPNGAVGASSVSRFKDVTTAFPWCKVQKEITVPCTTLDSYCRLNHIDHVDLIWCDIQGAESLMIKGATETLKKTTYLFAEVDGGTLYSDSKTHDGLMALLPPGWEIVSRLPGDLFVRNSKA